MTSPFKDKAELQTYAKLYIAIAAIRVTEHRIGLAIGYALKNNPTAEGMLSAISSECRRIQAGKAMKYSPALQVVEQVLRQLGEDFDPAKLAYFDDMPGDSSGAMANFLSRERNYTTEAVKQKRETVEQTQQNIPHLEAILALLEALHELCLAIEKQKFIDAAADLIRLVPENKRERVTEIICSPVTGMELESQLLTVVSTWKSGVREAINEVVKTKTHEIAPTISGLKNDIITKAQKEPEIGRSYSIYMGR